MICYICQNEVYLPVQIVCFPCYKRNKIHCFTFVRMCVACAVPYLQLDKSVEDRTNVKCLFCAESCDTKLLTTENSYCYDFWLIRESRGANSICPFCVKIIESNVTDHIRESCPYFYEQCICGRVTTKEWMGLHIKYCSHYIQCKLCQKHIKKLDYEFHCFETHDLLLCEDCGQYIQAGEFASHSLHRCPHRMVPCDFCREKVKYCDYEKHLLQHETDIQNALQSLREMSRRLYQQYSIIQKKRSDLFQNFFLES